MISSLAEYINFINEWTKDDVSIITKRIDRISDLEDQAFNGNPWGTNVQRGTDLRDEVFKRNNRFLSETKRNAKKELMEVKEGCSLSHSFYYRGQYNEKWNILPSVFRPEYINKESYLYHEIMVRCPDEFNAASHLDILVKMQHYDCPTRLLDVTSNPLVALYFACKNYGCEKCEKEKRGIVYLMRVSNECIAYSDSDRVLMLSCLAKFDTEAKRELIKQVNESLSEKKFTQKKGGSSYQESIVEQLFHEISREVPSFKREMVPMDLLKPIVVKPKRMNERILKQDGAFIINGLCDVSEEITFRLKTMVDEVLTIENKEQILNELDSIGINEASLFPEVDKVAGYLKENCRRQREEIKII